MAPSQINVSPHQRNRLLQILASILLLMAVLHILQEQQQLNTHNNAQQARELTRTLVEQAASTASRLVMEQDESGLAIMASRLIQHEAIYDVAIYDEKGQLLATNDGYQSLKERMAQLLSTQSEQRLDARVATIFQDGDAIGFIQMTVSFHTLLAPSFSRQELVQDRTRLALLLTLFAGILLANSVNPALRTANRIRQRYKSRQPEKTN